MTELVISGSPKNLVALQVTILNGASVSEMISTQGRALVGIVLPSGWTAADLAYKTCITGNPADLQTVYDSGGNAMKTTGLAASHSVAFPTSDAIFTAYLQLVSVSAVAGSVTPVTQGGDRTIVLLFRNFLS